MHVYEIENTLTYIKFMANQLKYKFIGSVGDLVFLDVLNQICANKNRFIRRFKVFLVFAKLPELFYGRIITLCSSGVRCPHFRCGYHHIH
ncbi:hypothetical protein DSUL_60077 [Desulfovibrionales bacterium]